MIPKRGALAAAVDWDAIPDGWNVAPLQQLADAVGGGTPSRDNPVYWTGGTIPWVTPTDVTASNGVLMSETSEMITEAGLAGSSATLLPAGSVLLTSRATIGACRVNTVPMATNQGFASLVPHDDADSLYLYYRATALGHVLKRLGAGTTFLEVSKKDVRRTLIPLPPLEERTKIAAILRSVDEAIERTEAVIAALREVKRGMMQELLTKGIGHTEFQETKIGKYPTAWQVDRLRKVVYDGGGFIQTGPFGSQLHSYEYVAEGIPVIMPQDIENGRVVDSKLARIHLVKAQELRRHRVRENDIVFARRGDLTKCAVITTREEGWLCGTGCFLLRPPTDTLDARWLGLLYGTPVLQRQIMACCVGTTMVNLNTTILGDVRISLPPLAEQKRIIEGIEVHQNAIAESELSAQRLAFLKCGLMQQLLTGKLRVAAQRG